VAQIDRLFLEQFFNVKEMRLMGKLEIKTASGQTNGLLPK
jgi:hypothetical protein